MALPQTLPRPRQQQPRQVLGPAPVSRDVEALANLDYDEKVRRHAASLSLAQRLGLVQGPAQPLTADQWEAIKRASDTREDSDTACSICLDDFRLRPQLILNCSHVFHAECLASFERFAGSRRCPLCRCERTDATHHYGGFMVWRRKCATRIQRAWRGYCSRRNVYNQLLRPECRLEAPALHRRVCGRALAAVSNRMERACEDREDALDRFLASLDQSVAESNQQLRDNLLGFEQLHGAAAGALAGGALGSGVAAASAAPEAEMAHASLGESAAVAPAREGASLCADPECWAKARRAALSRGDEVDCPICFQDCELRGEGSARVELLSCSHVFHRTCILSFESFHVFEVHQCPVCRQSYERRPWQAAAAKQASATGSRRRPPRAAVLPKRRAASGGVDMSGRR